MGNILYTFSNPYLRMVAHYNGLNVFFVSYNVYDTYLRNNYCNPSTIYILESRLNVSIYH